MKEWYQYRVEEVMSVYEVYLAMPILFQGQRILSQRLKRLLFVKCHKGKGRILWRLSCGFACWKRFEGSHG